MTETPPTAPSDVPPDVEAAYGTAIEDAFIAERGTPFLLCAKDWQLVRAWLAAGIPVDTVIRGIRETFLKRRGRGSVEKVGWLAYCENAVETRWEMERRGLVGSHVAGAVPAEPVDVAGRLAALSALVEAWREAPRPEGLPEAAARRGADGALEAIRGIDPSVTLDEVEKALAAAEKALLATLGKALGAPLADELAVRVAAAAGDLSALAAPARKKVEKALLARERRRLLALPPLTLFDV